VPLFWFSFDSLVRLLCLSKKPGAVATRLNLTPLGE
jgi:hypothetical protein